MLACASSGIAALNLPKGVTAHSTFKIPVKNLNAESVLSITAQSGRGELMRRVDLIIWDEISMAHRHAPETVDRTMRVLRGDQRPFGGCPTLWMGDFRQIPPVVVGGNRAKITRASVLSSPLWPAFTRNKMELRENMRVKNALREVGVERARELQDWNDYLIRIGNGTEPVIRGNLVHVPKDMMLPSSPNGERAGIPKLIDYVYGLQPPHLPERPGASATTEARRMYSQHVKEVSKFYCNKAFLTPTNKDVTKFNDMVMNRLLGKERTFASADDVVKSEADCAVYTTEFLNTLEFSGVPPHKLTLKLGCVIMLLRNLSARDGLCNGTRIVVTKLGVHTIEGVILTGM